mgnify:CR=1 FL=1
MARGTGRILAVVQGGRRCPVLAVCLFQGARKGGVAGLQKLCKDIRRAAGWRQAKADSRAVLRTGGRERQVSQSVP